MKGKFGPARFLWVFGLLAVGLGWCCVRGAGWSGGTGASEEGRRRAAEGGLPALHVRGAGWLLREDESEPLGVGFEQYRSWYPRGVNSLRQEIVVLPLGGAGPSPRNLAELAEFLRAYFAARVRLASPAAMPSAAYSADRNQYDASVLCRALRQYVREDTLAVLGVTEVDLYHGRNEFILGLGSLVERVAVFSTCRLGPGDSRLRRFKVAAHETGHALGMPHCGSARCLMNPARDLREADAASIHLCDECLRKLQWRRGCDMSVRYRRLEAFFQKVGLADEPQFSGAPPGLDRARAR